MRKRMCRSTPPSFLVAIQKGNMSDELDSKKRKAGEITGDAENPAEESAAKKTKLAES